MQEEADRLDREIAERHAREAAALEERTSAAPASMGENGARQLAGSLYEVHLSHDKV